MMIVNILMTVDLALLQNFKIRKIFLYLVFFSSFIVLTSGKSFSEVSQSNDAESSDKVDAQHDYEKYYFVNKDAIWKDIDKPITIDGYVYSLAIAESPDDSIVASLLKTKSKLMAISNITRNYPRNNIEWPSSYSQKLINEIWKHYLRGNNKKIQIDDKKFIVIDEGFLPDTSKYFFSVIVFQKSYLDSLFDVNFNKVFKTLKE